MKIVDANVLLYASNADAEHHEHSLQWLDAALSGADRVGLTWIVLLAFIRIATNGRLFPDPMSTGDALMQVEGWLGAPGAQLVEPTATHGRTLATLVAETGAAGNLINDAHLAALAVEKRADVVSYDTDFALFRGVRWWRPDDLV